MRIKLKRRGVLGQVKSNDRMDVDDIILREDLLNPDNEHIAVFLKGESVSGVINVGIEEARAIADLVNKKKKFIGDIKIIHSTDRIPPARKSRKRKNKKRENEKV